MRTPRGSPLFQVLVVAGAGLSASSCGGKSTGDTRSEDGDAAAGGQDASGGRGAGGREVGSGGTSAMGGTLVFGGAPSVGGTYSLPDEGTIAQWSCVLDYCMYNGNGQSPLSPAHGLDAPCPVTLSRPRSPEDCAAGEWFDCHPAFWQDQEYVWINCACSPMADASCGSCPETNEREATCEGQRRYCGCAQTAILR